TAGEVRASPRELGSGPRQLAHDLGRVAGNHELLVRGNDPGAHLGPGFRDAAFTNLGIGFFIEFYAEEGEPSTYVRTHVGRVLADAARKHDGIDAVHRGYVRADVFAQPVHEHLVGVL